MAYPVPRRWQQQVRGRAFTMTELVWAMIILAVVLTGFFGYLRMMQTTDQRLRQQQRALVVLDNTLERLAAAPAHDEATARLLLANEFASMSMPGKERLTAGCAWQGPRLVLAVRRADGSAVAQVELHP